MTSMLLCGCISQIRKWCSRRNMELADLHTAAEWPSWGLNAGSQSPDFILSLNSVKFLCLSFDIEHNLCHMKKYLKNDLWTGKEEMIPCHFAHLPLGLRLSFLASALLMSREWVVLYSGDISVHYGMFSSIPGHQQPFDWIITIPPLRLSKMYPDIAKYPRRCGGWETPTPPPRLRTGQGREKEGQSRRACGCSGLPRNCAPQCSHWTAFSQHSLGMGREGLFIFASPPGSWERALVGMTSLNLGHILTAGRRGQWVGDSWQREDCIDSPKLP